MIFGAATLVAVGAAAFFLFQTEQQIARLRSTLRAFDVRAREATTALADLRVAQQAYVAEGQGVDFWMPKVASLHESLTRTLAALRQSPLSAGASTALDEAVATVAEFGNIDRQTRDHITGDEKLMAADIIFTEGGQAAANAARQIETARLAEHQAADLVEAALRQKEALAAGAAAGFAVLVVLLLVPRPRVDIEETTTTSLSIAPARPAASVPTTAVPARAAPKAAAAAPRAQAPQTSVATRHAIALKAAASLATDFGRVRDADEMTQLLGRAATLMDASGVVIWLGTTTGAELAPMLAHGYGAQALSRMPRVPRSADNAAAAAYRTGQMQIVLARPGGNPGALVAPILAADGCIGALSAEIQGGGEASESVQALSTIVAAHLATVLANSRPAESEPMGVKETRAARG
jgi:GAF domain